MLPIKIILIDSLMHINLFCINVNDELLIRMNIITL